MVTRRSFAGMVLGGAIAGVAASRDGAWAKAVTAGAAPGRALAKSDAIRRQLMKLEADSGGRLGVAIVDTESSLHAGLRADERFPMCSTFKLLAAGLVLAR